VKTDPAAIPVGFGRKDFDLPFGNLDPAQTSQVLDEDRPFPPELLGIVDMLPVAPAAPFEEGTSRFDPGRSGLDDTLQGREDDPASAPGNGYPDRFPGNRTGNKDRLSFGAYEGSAAVDELFDLYDTIPVGDNASPAATLSFYRS